MTGGHVVGVLYRWTLQAVARQNQGAMVAGQRGGTQAA
jgi:hypothetical protein